MYENSIESYGYAGSFRHASRATSLSEGGFYPPNISGNTYSNWKIFFESGF